MYPLSSLLGRPGMGAPVRPIGTPVAPGMPGFSGGGGGSISPTAPIARPMPVGGGFGGATPAPMPVQGEPLQGVPNQGMTGQGMPGQSMPGRGFIPLRSLGHFQGNY